MGQLSRQIKEKLRQVRCRFRSQPVLSAEIQSKGQKALLELRKKQPLSEQENKVIWMYWDSGLDRAPEVVRLSHQSWCQFNPDYQVVLLSNANIEQYLDFDFNDIFPMLSVKLGAAGKSDLLRLYLLNRYGGVWADATTFCIKPLSQWLDLSQTSFFCFREKHSNDRNLVSWFLAAKAGDPIITDLLNASLDYLIQPRPYRLDIVGLKTTLQLAQGTQFISKHHSGFALLNYLESKYAAPYFWLFYLFNEVVKLPHNQLAWQYIEQQHNLCAEMYEGITSFKSSYVAKQTYREKYISGTLYQQRAEYISNLLNGKS
ncbi:capsular polysaccharide synthesis protein [Photobacterium damselae]|uniref:capsular polysaccharide synthesis protein n=1 Tax=Photobacterium damselae TaxID=38293 RepID=UPI0011D04B66|nr:capsular polysaccharide synthesis protein [Photobacterium damselae]KAB1519047.1 hypothetical protein FD717_004235 [Photobacterium damselae subsp. damselae]